jgi:hexosaminidase
MQVNILLKEAASNGLAVVPLVQTFGHMEFVLKHDAFASCREVPDGYMDICPLHSDSFNLVQAIVSQVRVVYCRFVRQGCLQTCGCQHFQAIHTHPGCKYIHIGCDEVFGIGSCHKCKTKLAEDGLEALFMDYVVPLLRYIRSQGVQPLIWHDMIEKYESFLARMPQ